MSVQNFFRWATIPVVTTSAVLVAKYAFGANQSDATTAGVAAFLISTVLPRAVLPPIGSNNDLQLH